MDSFNYKLLTNSKNFKDLFLDEDNFKIYCDQGWYFVILSFLIAASNRNRQKDLNLKKKEIKQKYGTLNIKLVNSDEYVDGLADLAEIKSSYTCEVCGNIGSTKNIRGKFITKCEKC